MSKVIGVGSVITSKEAYEHVIVILPLSIVDICGKVIVYLYVNSVKVAPTYLALSVGTIIVHVVLVQLQLNNPVNDVSVNASETRAPHEFSYYEYKFKSRTTFEVPPDPVNVLGNT